MKNKSLVIFGANSDIAQAAIDRFCEMGGRRLYLFSRNEQNLNRTINDLKVRFEDIYIESISVDFISKGQNIPSSFKERNVIWDYVLIAYGTLTDTKKAIQDAKYFEGEAFSNFITQIQIIDSLLKHKSAFKIKTLSVITSVAGDRGRASNYHYGALKKALSIYIEGKALENQDIHFVDVRPGFVDTKMTRDFKKGLLWAKPQVVAKDIVKAFKKPKRVLYTPTRWRFIMFIIRNVPYFIFRRMKL